MSLYSNIRYTPLWQLISAFRISIKYNRYKYLFDNSSLIYKFQIDRLADLLNYTKTHSPYYRDHLEGINILPSNAEKILKQLPILTKSIIRDKGEYIYSDDINPQSCTWVNTGGSTGEPLYFPRLIGNVHYESIMQFRMLNDLMEWRINEPIVSFSGYTPIYELITKKKFYKIDNNFPYGKYDFSSYFINEDNIEVYVNELNHIKPSIIRSYPSSIAELCRYMAKKNLRLDNKPKGVYVTSEALLDEDEQIINQVLGCPVWGQYGHTETSVFAIKPPGERKYFVTPFYGYTEVINMETGEHVDVDETGEIVVTGFTNLGLPFIRYATGDLAEYGGINERSEVILNNLQGRTIDYIINQLGEKVFLTGFIFGNHLPAFKNIFAWQIEQDTPGQVIMRIQKDLDYSLKDENDIMNHFLKSRIELKIDYDSEIKKSKRGKRIFMIQNCSN